jgi:FtsP/CotA-like multicopper oxidase with cupredoxin domain
MQYASCNSSRVSPQHWHGLFQKGTNYDDGPAFVSQCPLVPNEAFQYQFQVPDQAVVSNLFHSRVQMTSQT